MTRISDNYRVGFKQGRLTVVKTYSEPTGERMAVCVCSCGKISNLKWKSMFGNKTVSCGCYAIDSVKRLFTTHGLSKTTTYKIWGGMRNRCNNPNNGRYAYYGGRGIKVCKRWGRYENFLLDMGERPSKNHSLDRIDNSGMYSKENCRWALKSHQANNKRVNRYLTFRGKKLSLAQWGAVTKLHPTTIRMRLERGWSVKDTLTIKSLIGANQYTVISYKSESP